MKFDSFVKRSLVVVTLTFFMSLVLVLKVFAESLPEVEKVYKYANALYDTQMFNFARVEYLKIINLYPPNAYADESQYKVAECLRREGNYWYAIKEWDKLIKNYPESKYVADAKKEIEYAKLIFQNLESPIETPEEQLANKYIDFGNDFRGRTFITTYGLILRQENIDKALSWYDKAIKVCPEGEISAKAQYFKAELYAGLVQQDAPEKYFQRTREQDVNFLKKSIEEFKKVVDNYHGTYWANRSLQRMGDIYSDNLRDKKSAFESYQKLLENNKSDRDNYYVQYASAQIVYLDTLFDYDLKTFALQMHDWEPRALTAEEQLANKYINFAYTQFSQRSVRQGEFGIVYNQEELDAGFHWIDEAVKLVPKNSPMAAKAQYFRGEGYMFLQKQADYESAIQEYQKIIDNFPNSYWTDRAGIKIGDTYKDIVRDKGAAVKAYKEVITRNKENMDNYFVIYAITQIKYLGGSLDFMKKIK